MTEHSSEYATTASTPPPSRYDIRNLRRSSDDKIIAGVCGGLGRYTGLDPIIFRIVLATLAVFGGFGLLLYALAWLLVPQDNAETSQAHRVFRGHAGPLPTLAAIVVGIIGVFTLADVWNHGVKGSLALVIIVTVVVVLIASRRNNGAPASPASAAGFTGPTAYVPTPYVPTPYVPTAYVPTAYAPPSSSDTAAPLGPPAGFAPSRPAYPPPPPRPPRPPREPSMLMPLALSAGVVIAGILFALDASRSIDITAQAVFAAALLTIGLALVVGTWIGRARSLIAVGALLTVALAVTAAIDVPLRGGIGSRLYEPTMVSELRADYHLGIGDQTLDLSRVQFSGKTVHVKATVGLGRLVVDIPAGVSVVTHAHAGAGDLNILDTTTSGTNITRDVTASEISASASNSGHVDLDLRVGLGQVSVVRATPGALSPTPAPIVPPVPAVPPVPDATTSAQVTQP